MLHRVGLPLSRSVRLKVSPAAVAGGEHGVVGIRRIDLDIEHPVDGSGGRVGRQAEIERAASSSAEHRFPCLAAVDGAEHIVLAAGSVHTAERAGDGHFGIMRVHGHRGPSERFVLGGVGLHGCDLGPGAGVGIELPDAAGGHAAGSRRRAVGKVERSIGRHHHVGGPVLGGLARHGLPRLPGIRAAEQVVPAHQGDGDIDG